MDDINYKYINIRFAMWNVGKSEGRSLGRIRLRYVNNIKMDLREIGWMVLTGLIWLKIEANGCGALVIFY
jgi:hypothetical protein